MASPYNQGQFVLTLVLQKFNEAVHFKLPENLTHHRKSKS